MQAGSLAYLSRMAEEGALSAELAAWLDEGLGAEMVANRSLLLGPGGEVTPYYQNMLEHAHAHAHAHAHTHVTCAAVR